MKKLATTVLLTLGVSTIGFVGLASNLSANATTAPPQASHNSTHTSTSPTATSPTATSPTATSPTATSPTQTTPTGTTPTETTPTETSPTETQPTTVSPSESQPTTVSPSETSPTQPNDTSVLPSDTQPVPTAINSGGRGPGSISPTASDEPNLLGVVGIVAGLAMTGAGVVSLVRARRQA